MAIRRSLWSTMIATACGCKRCSRSKTNRRRSIMKNFSRLATTSRPFPNTRARPLVLAIALLFMSPALQAQPTGGQVVSGQASIGSPANGLMTINQTSPKAILNWQSFSIGVGEATHFQQPSGGVALNRITGGSPSQILGSLSSTGQVFLVNPSGVLFGKGAVLSVGGLVASTLDIANADFLDGNYRFFNTGDAKNITNQGNLGAYDGGYIALLAPEVRNEGVISARLGSVALGAGDRVSLDFDGDGLINLNIEASALNGRVENKHAIHADGGQVILSARAAGGLAETVINNSGLIRADSVAERNGRIVLEGAHFVSQTGGLQTRGGSGLDGGSIRIDAANVLLAGNADASGHQGGDIDVQASGNLIQVATSVVDAQGLDGVGGHIDLQASHADAGGQVFLSGAVSANGNMGGQVRVLGDKVTLVAADISATGKALGGEILIGGGFQGAATGVAHARRTSVNQATKLDASALDSGAGGRVVVWSDGDTAFAGQALARGGSQAGNGGLIEVSGKQNVFFDGQVNAGPASGSGANGVFLLDPKNITISAAALSSAGYFDLADPSPSAGDRHGLTTLQLDTDRLLVLSPYDSNAASQAGAIYVYDTLTGAMLSMLTGDQAGDQVGSGGFETLYNSTGYDFLVESPAWHGSAGALTWFDGEGSGQSGPSGLLGASNSLVGGIAGDQIASGGIEIIYNNGNYDFVVRSPEWNGTFGALTFVRGNIGLTGVVSSDNSLVGSHSGDRVGESLIRLTDYYYDDYTAHYAIHSPSWNGGAGAVTFMNRAAGVTGVVSAENSLVGSVSTDAVGSGGVEVIYDNGTYNYLVFSPEWDGGKGAVTFGSGESGVKGAISSNNSFVGDTAGDKVGSGGIITLYYNNGGYDYLLKSPDWHAAAGAVTWFDGSGFGGVDFDGVVSAANSLVGTTAGDAIGSGGFYQLNNGDYVVSSPDWDGGKGAATLVPSATGLTGEVSAANSLVGSSSTDAVSSGGVSSIYINNADNYLVFSPEWNGSFGAVTLGNGVTGEVTASNSFVGDSAGDRVGSAGYHHLEQRDRLRLPAGKPGLAQFCRCGNLVRRGRFRRRSQRRQQSRRQQRQRPGRVGRNYHDL
jgi:filamentous hemagglutinin family protein